MTDTLLPSAVRLDPIRAGSTDVRGIDLTGDLTPVEDTLASITSATVMTRDDGVALATGDLMVMQTPNPPFIDPAAQTMVGFWLTSDEAFFSNGVTVDYRIEVTARTAAGRTLIVDAMILVMPVRG